MPTTRLLLVRHGETIANREYRYIGARNEPLSAQGQMQATQLAEALSVLPVAAVYSSPLHRAYGTALAIAARHALEVQRVADLRECDFGTWEGLTRAEAMSRSPEDARRLLDWERRCYHCTAGWRKLRGIAGACSSCGRTPGASASR